MTEDARRTAPQEPLDEALKAVGIGGNHLASALIGYVSAAPWHDDLATLRQWSYDEILTRFGQPVADMWVAWKAIMDLRDVRAAAEAARLAVTREILPSELASRLVHGLRQQLDAAEADRSRLLSELEETKACAEAAEARAVLWHVDKRLAEGQARVADAARSRLLVGLQQLREEMRTIQGTIVPVLNEEVVSYLTVKEWSDKLAALLAEAAPLPSPEEPAK